MRRKNVWKKMTALALAAILIAPVGIELGNGSVVVEAAGTNLVANGDFDTDGGAMDVTGWTPGASTTEKEVSNIFANGNFDAGQPIFTNVAGSGSVDVGTEGSNKFLVVMPTSSSTYTIGKGGLPAVAGTEYTVSFKLKADQVTGSPAELEMSIVNRGASTAIKSQGRVKSSDYSTWTPVSYTVTADAGTTSWDLRFAVMTVATTWYIDDIQITSVGTEDKTIVTEHIPNSDFSATALNWISESSATGTVTLDNGKMKIMRTSGNCYAVCTDEIPATKGDTFAFSYRLTGIDSESVRVYPLVVEKNASNVQVTFKQYSPSYRKPTAAGGTVSDTFTVSNDNTTSLEIKILVNNANGTAWIDDFHFTSEQKVYTDGVILNGSDYAMKLSNDNSASYSDLTLLAGKKYEYSYEVAADSTLTKALLTVGSQELSATSGIFTYADGAVGLKTAGTGVAYFDNIVISEHTHVDTAPADEVCDTCGDNLHQHTMSGWENDGTNHWKECTQTGCTYREDEGLCAGGTATCYEKATCATCGLKHGGFENHTMSGWVNNGTNHWKECTVSECSHKEDEGTCAGGTATCLEKATCATCGLKHGDEANHKLSEWINNGTKHWKECTEIGCEYVEGEGTCAGGTATCQKEATCETCSLKHGTLAGHVDADNSERCDVCDADLHVHVFTKQVVKDATLKSAATTYAPAVYYKSCECGEISDTETFQYGNKLEVEEQKKEDDTPKAPITGDSIPAIWLYVMVMSVGVIVFCVKKKIQEI